nr:Chain E, CYCLIC PEPTIDE CQYDLSTRRLKC [synthetic construct]5T1M_F Chain F, CYCLIC PEPTIDE CQYDLSTRRLKC [synthetic construct]5T1M_H Chain H, CYCLIC PEPTIDE CQYDLSTRRLKC [synthetic construct]
CQYDLSTRRLKC